ncbi:RNA recognition motif. (a.k.a. RRM, RBD, or RNP domain) [Chitinophaga jiangningensis]|uniref:RNA recognition motif. (A.k.a. RRM, RBD, or RNP domain) n=1 Tax=Chitinophaga jiangningensis TaxID=1419482 RepID=A0A1M7KIG4_9BACT|nr:RNA-binding protein [Chitinophaga jiangningensis]SHM65170.1 RNA recognition motif. (a.k.a. RRM, RBD, or RNP domain) [Chitinophaga jiangningensis]
MNLFVGNLSDQTTEQQLSELFAPFGAVQSAKVIYDTYSGRSKGFAFIDMPDAAEAERAMRNLNETFLDRKAIVVNEARPRADRERFPRPRY